MGIVFEAEDEVLGRLVAIKRLKAVDELARRRFWREARAVARLSHPNVCQLYEVGEDGSGLFLAMELLSGEALSTRLQRKPMSAEEVVPLGAGILAALQAVHAAGLVHRDLKPSNIYLTPYGPRLLDFGLARPIPPDVLRRLNSMLMTPSPVMTPTPLTDPDHLVGTPRYMSPEQILDQPVDGRADLFAAGALLYEALTGRPAFGGRQVVEVLSATLQESPAPLPPRLARLDAVLRRALAKRPQDRYANAQEMAEALHAAAAAPAGAEPRRSADSESGEIFVGRQAELAWLQERLDAALAGRGRRRVRDRRARRRQDRARGRDAARRARSRPCRSRSSPAAASSTRARAIRSSRSWTRSGGSSARAAGATWRSSSSRPGRRPSAC